MLAEAKVGLGATDLGAAIDEGLERLSNATTPDDDGRVRTPMLDLLVELVMLRARAAGVYRV